MRAAVTVFAALLITAVAMPAAAKGASEATITGAGLDAPISVTTGGEGDPNGPGDLTRLGDHTGFFPAVFGQRPDPMRTEAPAGQLGPEYTITWVLPGPVDDREIVMLVYPFAEGGAVSFVEPGQPYFEVEETQGGWYVGGERLHTTLVDLGLPATAELATTARTRVSGTVVAVVLAALVLTFGLFVAVRGSRLRQVQVPAS